MNEWKVNTPVAFLVFNRPDTTARVFEAIRQAGPPRLLVVADGPRPDRAGEAERCAAVRAIVEKVDWPCEVLRNYSDTNLGCKRRVSTGLDWVFETVEEAIILEDDCLPHPTFFRYCEELLERYRDDKRVMMISGDNFQFGRKRTAYSYYFSIYSHIWGWASWRRAWSHYDIGMTLWPEIKSGEWLLDILGDRDALRYWTGLFDAAYRNKVNTWDHQLAFSLWLQGGLTVLPNANLVSNIGFGADSTHTPKKNHLAGLPTEPMGFPLNHPPVLIRDRKADRFEHRRIYNPGLFRQILWKLSSFAG